MNQFYLALMSALFTFTACFCYAWKFLISDDEARAINEAMRMFRTRDGEKNPNSYRLGRLLDRHGFLNKDLNADKSEWFSVADKLPEEMVDVLVSAEYDPDIPHSWDAMHVCRMVGGKWLEGIEHNMVYGVTYWRNLPASPKGKP